MHSRNQAHHTQHRQLEHAPVHVAAPHVRQHAAVHPLLRRGVPIPDGVQQALVQRLPRKLPVLREARAHVASNQIAHASRERHTVQHANDANHAVLHAGAGRRQCEHGAEEDAEMHRVRHDVRQAREAHRSPRTHRFHAAPPLEGRRHTAVHAPKHSGEQRVAHHHPQRVKGSEHRQEVRQSTGIKASTRALITSYRRHCPRGMHKDGPRHWDDTLMEAERMATDSKARYLQLPTPDREAEMQRTRSQFFLLRERLRNTYLRRISKLNPGEPLARKYISGRKKASLPSPTSILLGDGQHTYKTARRAANALNRIFFPFHPSHKAVRPSKGINRQNTSLGIVSSSSLFAPQSSNELISTFASGVLSLPY
ncbi:hypothetical protein TCDM_12508 [Trypanosoma cruzi Dm28c]|uniref:Uncharacterized protein n=1 Tax=Trypanosoma cruzi Dm28c TaxID=1416333 RepID=V5AV27_TRYCR|nr:hypothetical protein TCDM_12508 [Trypanosoma cruzi Dm28c]